MIALFELWQKENERRINSVEEPLKEHLKDAPARLIESDRNTEFRKFGLAVMLLVVGAVVNLYFKKP